MNATPGRLPHAPFPAPQLQRLALPLILVALALTAALAPISRTPDKPPAPAMRPGYVPSAQVQRQVDYYLVSSQAAAAGLRRWLQFEDPTQADFAQFLVADSPDAEAMLDRALLDVQQYIGIPIGVFDLRRRQSPSR